MIITARIQDLKCKEQIESMLEDSSITLSEIVDFVESQGENITKSAIARYQLLRTKGGEKFMEENWYEFMSTSLEPVLKEAEQDPEFTEADNLIITLLEKASSVLSQDEVFELEDALITKCNIQSKAVYQKGLQDGKFLFSLLAGKSPSLT